MRRASVFGLVFALTGGLAGSASAAPTSVSSDIVADTNWGVTIPCSLADPIVLENPIFVKDGATLTISAGCVVRGQPRESATLTSATGTPGALIVTQTGRVQILGTPSAPVIFTTAASDNNNDGICDDVAAPIGFCDPWNPGDTFFDDTPTTAPLAPVDKAGEANLSMWGGVVILGNAPTNLADKSPAGYGKAYIEGLAVPGFDVDDATYGGTEPHDNSGTIRYVSIRHGGDEIGDGNELNGLTLAGVGDGTTIENVEIYANFDDGIEWFGGTVSGRRLAVFMVGDDMFDIDQGYTGVNQFLFGIAPWFNEYDNVCAGSTPDQPYGSASGDKGGEFDGDDYNPDGTVLDGNLNVRLSEDGSSLDPTPWPFSAAAIYNATLLGANISLVQRGSGAGTVAGPQTPSPNALCGSKRGFQARNGFAGDIFNSMVVNTSTEEGLEVDPQEDPPVPPATLTDGAPGFGADANALAGRIRLVCSTFDDTGALDANETAVVNFGNTLSEDLRGLSPTVTSDDNVINGAFTNLVNEDQTFDPDGNAAGKLVAALKAVPINPRPQGLAGVGGCVAPAGRGLDSAATYRGAFPAGAAPLWTQGWTSLSQAGLLN